MKKGLLSISAVLALNSVLFAGGNIAPVVPVVPPVVEEDHSDWYVGLGLVYGRTYSTDSGWWDDSVDTQDETLAPVGIIGYNYNEYIGIEGRYSKTMWERNYSDVTTWSIFLKPQYRFRENDRNEDGYDDGYFTVYGLLGFGNSNVEGTDGDNDQGAWASDIGRELMDETGFQWGFGFSYTFVDYDQEKDVRKNTWTIFVDYTMTADDVSIDSTRLYEYDKKYYDKLSTDGLTVGVTYTF